MRRVALSPVGCGTLVETKGWEGPITGNDGYWTMPDVFDESRERRQGAPANLLGDNAKKLGKLINQCTEHEDPAS